MAQFSIDHGCQTANVSTLANNHQGEGCAMATFTKRVSKATGKASYKVQVRRKGAVPLTKTFSRKTDAQRWANDREAEINQNTHFGYATAQNNNLHDVIERYIKEILPHKAPETARGQTGQLGW